MNESQAKVRASLLGAALWFVQSAARLPGVQRIALIGSILSEHPSPKDVDLVVYVVDDTDLTPLASLARRLKGRLRSQNRRADVFLADEGRHYLGRTCSWKPFKPRVPADVERLVSHLQQRHNIASERTTGSHSRAAAAQHER